MSDVRVVLGIAACAVAIILLVVVLVGPRRPRLPASRRRPGVDPGPGRLSEAATVATAKVDDVLRRRGGTRIATLLEGAGVRSRPQDVVFLTVVGSLAAGAVGVLAGGPLLGILFALATPLVVRTWLRGRTMRRCRAFADQLDETLQLMASSLRAGHSLLQALASVAREAEEPASEEFARVVNETRVGRELGPSLVDTARRMASDDFAWVAQAIAINREVGGNLAEVLDGVGVTIRERNQVRRQVRVLSAEGRLSAVVLMLLPIGIAGFLLVANRDYVMTFTQSPIGYGLIALAVVLLVAGGLWLRSTVRIAF